MNILGRIVAFAGMPFAKAKETPFDLQQDGSGRIVALAGAALVALYFYKGK